MKLKACNVIVHETANPEVVVAEWDYDGLATMTGRSFRVSKITVSTIRNGKIVAPAIVTTTSCWPKRWADCRPARSAQ
jgi:ketosteroid isomerase-like protein